MALATAAPLGSTTVPCSEVVEVCATARRSNIKQNNRNTHHTVRCVRCVPYIFHLPRPSDPHEACASSFIACHIKLQGSSHSPMSILRPSAYSVDHRGTCLEVTSRLSLRDAIKRPSKERFTGDSRDPFGSVT